MRSWLTGLILMVALTLGLYRLLVVEIPHLPWEKPAPLAGHTDIPVPVDHPVLRIGVGDRPAYLPLLALAEWTDVKVQIVSVPDASQRWVMLSDGRLDMASGTLDSFALASLHLPVGSYLFSIGTGAGEDSIVAQTGTSKLADLVGKTIAVPRGGPGEYLLGLLLSNDGLSLSQSHLVYTATAADAATLLQKNSVQAAVLWEPALNTVKGDVVVASTADPKSPHADEMCAASFSALSHRRADVTSAVQGYFRLVESLRTKPGLTRGAIARAADLPAGTVADYMKSVQFANLADNRNLDPAAIGAALADAQSTLRMIGKKPTVQNDPSKLVQLDVVRQLPTGGSDN